jgi:hypothetical protein
MVTVNFTVTSTGIDHLNRNPGFNARLYPNPSAEIVNIEFSVSSADDVVMAVCDIKGSKICDILRMKPVQGKNTINWNRRMTNGEILPPGVYFLRIMQSGNIEILKMIIE